MAKRAEIHTEIHTGSSALHTQHPCLAHSFQWKGMHLEPVSEGAVVQENSVKRAVEVLQTAVTSGFPSKPLGFFFFSL